MYAVSGELENCNEVELARCINSEFDALEAFFLPRNSKKKSSKSLKGLKFKVMWEISQTDF